ncbi:site-specific integrase [Photobacterium kishitanii]|uniref:site-specific integrase n=1 Tax=Photobacterium kishitanii TaxID=318456 RepID=UPI000AFD0315|nr:site-specific integrase [Photobacterium kishitanii]
MSKLVVIDNRRLTTSRYKTSSGELLSKDGYSFNINSNHWKLNKDAIISFQCEVLALDPKILESFRKTLSNYAQEASGKHTQNMYHRFQRMVRDTKCTVLDENTILNWRSMLDNEHEWYLGSLRGFLISWYDYGYYGVSSDVIKVLENMTLSGNKKGVAVANRCPYSGAFTPNEVLALNNELIRLFKADEISFACYSYLNTLQATARRPVQLRQLKGCDLINGNLSNFYLNVPRSKQRGGSFRGEFNKLPITEELYLILHNLHKSVVTYLEKEFNTKLSLSQIDQAPLFVDFKAVEQLVDQSTPLSSDLLLSDLLHVSTLYLRHEYVQKFQIKQKAISERTGDYILISARRFRHTRGTNLGRKGLGGLIIAEALDHSDTQNIKVYCENTADTVTYIDKVMGSQLAPFANAFLGKIIESADDGERGNDPTARIPNDECEVVGACGTNDFCVKGYEACYLCHKFRPLIDAPHEKLLANLYAEKEQRLKTTKSEEYASTKDRLILAVEWVVQKCAEMKAEKEVNDGK